MTLSLSLSHLISIQPVERLQEVDGFLRDARVQMFGARVSAQTRRRICCISSRCTAAAGRMWAAHDAQRGVVGSIAYRPYDGRFAQLDFGPLAVVEVVRLFVAPVWRRQGLAQALWATLQAHAQAHGVEVLYLHTHPFLPGRWSSGKARGLRCCSARPTRSGRPSTCSACCRLCCPLQRPLSCPRCAKGVLPLL
jgi:GNAT superfamily N-acetyltransferase